MDVLNKRKFILNALFQKSVILLLFFCRGNSELTAGFCL